MANDPKASKKPISVEAKITPITQTPVEDVRSVEFMTCPIGDLYEQITTMRNRYYALMEMEKWDMAEQVQSGVNLLEAIIKKRQDKQPGIL